MKTAKTLAGNPLAWFLGRRVSSETAPIRAPLRRRVRNVVCFAAAAAAMSLFADTWTDGSGVTWKYSVSEGEAEILGPDHTMDPAIPATTRGVIEIPDTLGGCPVTRIGCYAFKGCSRLTGVEIPDSVISIGAAAFEACTSLTEIRIPDSVEEIEPGAFGDCDSLRSVVLSQAGVDDFVFAFDTDNRDLCVTLSEGVGNIRDHAFNGCCMASVTIPDSVTNIGSFAFADCYNLTSMEIPASVEKIGQGVFSTCPSLEEIVVDEGNTNYEVIGGLLVEKRSKKVKAAPGVIESLRITSRAREVGNQALLGSKSLKTLIIPGEVSVVGYASFAECDALSKLTIAEGVESIGVGAFYDCPALESVRLPASLTNLGMYAFGKCKNLKLVVMPRIEFDDLVFSKSNPGLVIRYLDESAPFKLTVKANNSKFGTASGGGGYEPGAKATLKAKAKDGYAFAGWFTDKACTKPLNPKGYDNRKPTVKILVLADKTKVYAKFITLAEDKKALKFTSATKKLAKTAAKAKVKKSFTLKLGIKSASYPTVTAKGLPAGLSIDKTTGEITGKAKKTGTYTVKVKVKDYAGNVISQKVKIKVQ